MKAIYRMTPDEYRQSITYHSEKLKTYNRQRKKMDACKADKKAMEIYFKALERYWGPVK